MEKLLVLLLCGFRMSLERSVRKKIQYQIAIEDVFLKTALLSHPTKNVFPDDHYGNDTQDRFACWILFTPGSCRHLVIVTLVQIHYFWLRLT